MRIGEVQIQRFGAFWFLIGVIFLCTPKTSMAIEYDARLLSLECFDTICIDVQNTSLVNSWIDLAIVYQLDSLNSESILRGDVILSCLARNLKRDINTGYLDPESNEVKSVLSRMRAQNYSVYFKKPSEAEKLIHYVGDGKTSSYCHIVDAVHSRVLKMKHKGIYFLLVFIQVMAVVAIGFGVKAYYYKSKSYLLLIFFALFVVGVLAGNLIVQNPDSVCDFLLQ